VTPSDSSLLRLLQWDWVPPTAGPWIGADEAEWAEIVRKALDHGVAGLACRALARLPAGAAPADLTEAAVLHLASVHVQGAKLVAQLTDVAAALTDHDIPVLSFKGPVLGMLAHDSATVRLCRDLDVLVHRRDMGRSIATLGARGFRFGEHFTPRIMEGYIDTYGQVGLHADGRVPVDVHCAFAPRSLALNVDMKGLWKRARPVQIAGRSILTLSPEDTLLVACLHGTKEKWWRLLWVADVAALVQRHPDLDWGALMVRAEAYGVRRMVALGLALAQDLFASQLPDVVTRALADDRSCARLVAESKVHLFASAAAIGSVNHASRYHLQARERMSDRLRYLWRVITTPGVNHFRMVSLPGSLFSGYVVIKLVHDYVLLPLWGIGKGRAWRRSRKPHPDEMA
jgi:hypothetical protein